MNPRVYSACIVVLCLVGIVCAVVSMVVAR